MLIKNKTLPQNLRKSSGDFCQKSPQRFPETEIF